MLSIDEISARLKTSDISKVAREANLAYNTLKALRAGQRGAHGKTIEKLTEYFSGANGTGASNTSTPSTGTLKAE